MASIEIDGKTYEAEAGQTLIEFTDAQGIDIPRFCYHKKLSTAASCRMCLVDVENAPKPLPACATPIMDGMKIQTKSPRALSAQKAVMEFLLINHPLDCPICDQGGECELQDVAMGYGKDRSRYIEEKRVILEKNLGSLIATAFTRCIHCTRCVRFGEEIAGVKELGTTYRGDHMKIDTYMTDTVDSELSGNVIDICPVGALTAKPSRFSARAWEMQVYNGIAPHDGLGSNIELHVRRNQVIRVVPRENETLNEVWLSDRDRFSYQGLYSDERLQQPMIKKDGQWQTVDWQTALLFAAEGLKKIPAKQLGGLASETATVEELYLFQKLIRGLGSNNLDHRLQQIDFSGQDKLSLRSNAEATPADLESMDVVLVVGSHLRKHQPLLNARLRKAVVNHQAKVLTMNFLAVKQNFPVAQALQVTPNNLVENLAGIAKALLNERKGKPTKQTKDLPDLLAGVDVNDTHRVFANYLHNSGDKKITVMLGEMTAGLAQLTTVRALLNAIADLAQATFTVITQANNSVGACIAGVLPHKGIAGQSVDEIGLNASQMLSDKLQAYVLLGIEPELDSVHGIIALNTLQQANFVISINAYQTTVMQSYADVIFPSAIFSETSGTYINGCHDWQSFSGAVKPVGEARPAWKILRVLANLLDIQGCDYNGSDEILVEVKTLCEDLNKNELPLQLPNSLDTPQIAGLQRIHERALYSTDTLVRRSTALQRTEDAKACFGVHLNSKTIAQLGLSAGNRVKVSQAGHESSQTLILDERVADDCVLLYSGLLENAQLPHTLEQITITAT